MSDQGPVPPADPSGGQPHQQPQYPAQPQYGQPAQPQYPAPDQGYPQQYAAPGQQPYPLQYGGAPAPGKTNALALTALIVGVVGLLLCWVPFLGVIVGIAAVVLGFLGMRKAAEIGGKGLAIGGIVTGGITLLIGLVFTIITLAVVNAVDNSDLDQINDEIQQQLEEDLNNG